jgi:hypothetical protein
VVAAVALPAWLMGVMGLSHNHPCPSCWLAAVAAVEVVVEVTGAAMVATQMQQW